MPFPEAFRTIIGAGATLVDANVPMADLGQTIEELDRVIDSPGSPLRDLYENDEGWDGGDRCVEDVLLETAYLPIPNGYVVPGNTLDNNCCAIRLTNGMIFESQPFVRCTGTGDAVVFSGAVKLEHDPDSTDPDYLIEGPGEGARGGSGIPVWFTTIRESEVDGTTDPFPHAMCWIVPPSWLSQSNGGYRWPAVRADGHYLSVYSGAVTALRMGSLLALPSDFDENALTTDMGKKIAKSLKQGVGCGAVVGDIREDSPGEVVAIAMAQGPTEDAGEAFNTEYGSYFEFDISPTTTDDYGLDMRAILAELKVVSNNAVNNIGGGGGGGSSPAPPSVSTLEELVFARDQAPLEVIKHNGITIAPDNPYSDDGTPGVLNWTVQKSYASPKPVAEIELNRIPESAPGVWAWPRGQEITIDAGYEGASLTRLFKGTLYSRGNENPDALRTRTFVQGAALIEGTAPDQTRRTVNSFATLTGSSLVQPPLPTGRFLDQESSNPLLDTDAIAAEVAARLQTEAGRVPRNPGSEIRSRVMRAVGTLHRLFMVPEVPERDFTGMTLEEALGSLCDECGITSRTIVAPDHTLGTNPNAVTGATLSRMRLSQMADYVMAVKGIRVAELNSGLPIFKVVNFAPAPTARWSYNSTEDDISTRIVEGGGAAIRVPLNPLMELGDTIDFDFPEAQVVGRYFVSGLMHRGGQGGYYTDMLVVGGDEFGGSVSQNPTAVFTFSSVRQAIGGAMTVLATFDARASFDPDGAPLTDSDVSWSDNQSPEIVTGDGLLKTVRVDAADLVAPWIVTLTAGPDADGLTGELSLEIPVDPAEVQGPASPAIYAALSEFSSASGDGGETFNDQADGGDKVLCVDPLPYTATTGAGIACFGCENGVILRTTDFCASAMAEVYNNSAAGDVLVMWADKVLHGRFWAGTRNGYLLRSDDRGETWDEDTIFADGAQLRWIATPLPGGIYVGGGRGDQPDTLVRFRVTLAGAWNSVPMGGALGTALLGAGPDLYCAAAASRQAGELLIMFGGDALPGGPSIWIGVGIPDTPVWGAAMGLDDGLWDGVQISPDLEVGHFHAVFRDRDTWHTTDRMNWAKTADVLDSGEAWHHLLWEGEYLGDISGVYLGGTVRADLSGAIVKSTDGLLTKEDVRPGIDTWATDGQGLYVAIGAQGSAVPVVDRLHAMSNEGVLAAYDASLEQWVAVGTPEADMATGEKFRLCVLSGGGYLVINNRGFAAGSSTTDGLWYSETGAVWENKIPARPDASFDAGPIDIDLSPNGDIWCADGRNVIGSDDNTQAAAGLKFWRSQDRGATWDLEHSDAGFTGSTRTNSFTPCRGFACNSEDTNELYAFGHSTVNNCPRSVGSIDGGGSFSRRTSDDVVPNSANADEDTLRSGANGTYFYLPENPGDDFARTPDKGVTWDNVTGIDAVDFARDIGWRRHEWFQRNLLIYCKDADANTVLTLAKTEDDGVNWADVHVFTGVTGHASVEYDVATDTAYVAFANDSANGDDATVYKIANCFGTPTVTDITANLLTVFGDSDAQVGLRCLALPR